MQELTNIEFYNTPEGEVMIKEIGSPVKVLDEKDRDFISKMLSIIKDRYPDAFEALMDIYSKSSRNVPYFQFKAVSRFIRCNFGEYDYNHFDIESGSFSFEEVRCPLRGECKHECVICKPRLNTALTDRELEVLRLIARNMQTDAIADELHISPCTVARHRDNIRQKIGAKNTAELVKYWLQNNLK